MARYRSRMALRPINRVKHVVDASADTAAAASGSFVIVNTVDSPTLANTNEVELGSKINGFYIRLEVVSNQAEGGGIPNAYMYLAKNVGNNLTLPAANAVGADDNKRFVIHQEMTMIENNGPSSNARTIFNGVVVVPKGMRRNGPNDRWIISTLAPALATSNCVQVHYKEFR